jgi:hypothetical protein
VAEGRRKGLSRRGSAEPLSACRRLGRPRTCSYTFLLASVVCNCCQKRPRRGLGQALSRNKKSWECGGWAHNCEMLAGSVGTLISLSHHRQADVERIPLSLGTVAENSLLKLRWHVYRVSFFYNWNVTSRARRNTTIGPEARQTWENEAWGNSSQEFREHCINE